MSGSNNDDDPLLRPGNTSDRTVSASTRPPRRGAGVRKMNRVPLAIGLGAAAVVAGVVLYTAEQRAHRHGGSNSEDTSPAVAAAPPMDLAAAQHKAVAEKAAEDAKTRNLVAQAEAPHSPAPAAPQKPANPYEQEWQEYYQELAQERQRRAGELAAAIGDDTGVKTNGLDNAPESGAPPKQPVDSDYLASYRTGARNALEVKEGTIIPAALVGGINSDVAGMIKAQVRENVFDSATGETVLIPQGASIIGEFHRTVGYGQTRIEVAFTRIIFPDQSSIDLGAMEGADMAGNAGFEDQVNNHWFKVFGNALLAAAFGAGVQLSQNNNSLGGSSNYGTGGYSAQQIVAAQLGQQVGELGMEIARRGLDIPPTITIRPGYLFNIMVRKDMIFPPYQDRWGNGLLHQVTAQTNGGR